jgi:DHA2 family multidrug resistance protein
VSGENTQPNVAAITICATLATVIQALDTTIANVALPYMQGNLGATLDQINWVLTSYIVSAAIMTPPTAWLADRLGRKRLFLATVAGFTAASVLCGLAQSLPQIVLFRLLQGAFGAPLVPLAQATLLDHYPREKHGSAMAMWGVGVMVGPILGPTLGGWLTESYDWRWVFYINLPIGICTLLGLWRFLPPTLGDERLRFDWFGFATLSLAIAALQLLLDRGQELDWFSSPEIQFEAGASALALYLFLVHIATAKRPFIEPRIFRDRNFSAGLGFIFVVGVILLATLALLTPYLQSLMQYPVATAGMVLAPRGMGTMAAMLLVGRLIQHVDPRGLLLCGLSLTALALGAMTGFTPDVSERAIVWTGVLQGLGLGFIFTPLSTMTFATLAPEDRTQGTALFALLRNIGSSIGVSVVIFLLAQHTQTVHAELVEQITPFRVSLLPPLLHGPWNLNTLAGRAALNQEITRQATIVAYVDDFKLMTSVALLCMPLVALLRRPRALEVLPSAEAAH